MAVKKLGLNRGWVGWGQGCHIANNMARISLLSYSEGGNYISCDMHLLTQHGIVDTSYVYELL